MEVDLNGAKFYSGLFTDGCIMLMEGHYNKGILYVNGIGLAPIETADETRAHIGQENWFGGESSIAVREVPRLVNACRKNLDASIIFASDVWLDDQRVGRFIFLLIICFYPSHFL